MNTNDLELKSDSIQSMCYTDLGYEPLPRIADLRGVHPFCDYRQTILHMEETIAVGFGRAFLTKDNDCVNMYDEMIVPAFGNCMTVAQAEEMAAADPKHDWRIHLIAPLSDWHYQRQGRQNWVLYAKGPGFFA